MSENQKEFAFQAVLQNYSVQDLALNQLLKQIKDVKTPYSETLKRYEEKTKKNNAAKEKCRKIRTEIAEKLAIKSGIDELQVVRKKKIKGTIQKEGKLIEKLAENSDNFVKSINHEVGNIKNLGKEFDEYAISQDKEIWLSKTETVKEEIRHLEDKLVKDLCKDNVEKVNKVEKLRQLLSDNEKVNYVLGQHEYKHQSKKQVVLMKKNTEFLRQRIQELQQKLNRFM